MDQPYIADRATLEAWAENGDARAAEFLAYPGAVLFGIDDDEIQVGFATQAKADKWLAIMQADAAERAADRRLEMDQG